jgi:hypothetical protein
VALNNITITTYIIKTSFMGSYLFKYHIYILKYNVVGNVNKFAVVPPGYNGQPKKGHLIFDACFECGMI